MTWPSPSQIHAPARPGELVGWRATHDAIATPPAREAWRVIGAGRCHAVTASIVASWGDDPRVASVYDGPRLGRRDAIAWRVDSLSWGAVSDLVQAGDLGALARAVRFAIAESSLMGRRGPVDARPSRHDSQIARELARAWGALVARLDARSRAPESALEAIARAESRRAARSRVDSAPHVVAPADRRHVARPAHYHAPARIGGRSYLDASACVSPEATVPIALSSLASHESPARARRVDSARLSMGAVRARSVARRAASLMHGLSGAEVDLRALARATPRPAPESTPAPESPAESRARRDLDRARALAARATRAGVARSALTVAAWPNRVAPRLVSTIAVHHGAIVASLWYQDAFPHRVKRAGDRDSLRIPSDPVTLS